MDQVDHKSIVELENILIAVNFSHKVTSEVLEAIKNRFNFINNVSFYHPVVPPAFLTNGF